jgi:hypothetical protein
MGGVTNRILFLPGSGIALFEKVRELATHLNSVLQEAPVLKTATHENCPGSRGRHPWPPLTTLRITVLACPAHAVVCVKRDICG